MHVKMYFNIHDVNENLFFVRKLNVIYKKISYILYFIGIVGLLAVMSSVVYRAAQTLAANQIVSFVGNQNGVSTLNESQEINYDFDFPYSYWFRDLHFCPMVSTTNNIIAYAMGDSITELLINFAKIENESITYFNTTIDITSLLIGTITPTSGTSFRPVSMYVYEPDKFVILLRTTSDIVYVIQLGFTAPDTFAIDYTVTWDYSGSDLIFGVNSFPFMYYDQINGNVIFGSLEEETYGVMVVLFKNVITSPNYTYIMAPYTLLYTAGFQESQKFRSPSVLNILLGIDTL